MQALTVYCGSCAGNNQCYTQAAQRLGLCLAERKITLVYGGARVGLMGAMADSILGAGGNVIGIIPKRPKSTQSCSPRSYTAGGCGITP